MLNKRKREKDDQDRPRRKRAAIYLRGLGEDTPVLVKVPSIDTQRRFCQLEAQKLDAEVVGEFVDKVGASEPLPGFGRLVDRLDEEPRLDYLIVYSLDRLVPGCDGAFTVGWLLGSAGTILVSWFHAYESELERKTIR